VADHNLTDNVEMSNSSANCSVHCRIGQPLGFIADSQGPLYFIGTNMEHSNTREYAIGPGAANYVFVTPQTEQTTPALVLNSTSNIVVYGTVFTYRYNQTEPLVQTIRSAAHTARPDKASALDTSYRLYGLYVLGSKVRTGG
jgi:hypothetical protein